MYFQGSVVYFNNITLLLLALIFVSYALVRARSFYKARFYVVFLLHFCALALNTTHAFVIQHQVANTTLTTELCLFLLLCCFFALSTFWTYWYYLRFVYSLVTQYHFKTFSRLLRPLAFWKSSHRDYYDYDTLDSAENRDDDNDDKGETDCSHGMREIGEDGWFRFMNYQVLGNYLFTQMFNLYALTATYFVRSLAIGFDLNATTQLALECVALTFFVMICGFFDFRYRRFTKALIMPHLTVLVLVGYWMLEHYERFDRKRPEPASIITFIVVFVYIVVKFSFLTEVATMEKLKKKLN